jgi:toxin ParE1/3/4
MTRKRVVPRQQATDDFDRIVDYYLVEAGDEVTARFIRGLRSAYRLLEETPGAGSRRLSQQTGFHQLRTWPVSGFPYLICYVERSEHVDVWRVLHDQRDLASVIESGSD